MKTILVSGHSFQKSSNLTFSMEQNKRRLKRLRVRMALKTYTGGNLVTRPHLATKEIKIGGLRKRKQAFLYTLLPHNK